MWRRPCNCSPRPRTAPFSAALCSACWASTPRSSGTVSWERETVWRELPVLGEVMITEHVATLAWPALLVLDDVGVGGSKEGEIERKLFTRVIGTRYNARKSMVITANLSTKELETAMGDRAFDRIQHACEWVVFDGPQYRAEVKSARVQGTLGRIRQAAGPQ